MPSYTTLSKQQYRDICASDSSLMPLFHQPFWLDAVCGGAENWHVAALADKQGDLVAALPFITKTKLSFINAVTVPPLCPANAPIIVQSLYDAQSKEDAITGMEHDIWSALLEQLPAAHLTRFVCAPSLPSKRAHNMLAAFWQGFEARVSYSYIIDTQGRNIEEIKACYSKSHRHTLKKSLESGIKVSCGGDAQGLHTILNKTFEKQGRSCPYSLSQLKAVSGLLQQHDCGAIYEARNEAGALCAAALIVKDGVKCTYLASGVDPAYAALNPIYPIIDQALRDACADQRPFDFEGSRIQGIEHFFRRFGGTLCPIYILERKARWLRFFGV
jgi:hypothetical protein